MTAVFGPVSIQAFSPRSRHASELPTWSIQAHRTRSPRRRSRSPDPRRHRHRNNRSRTPKRNQPSSGAPSIPSTQNGRTRSDFWTIGDPVYEFLDTNLIYGLVLPRKVISTSASRTLGIDQIPIHEVRVYQLMQEGSYDWCLRNLAAGKACYLEMFRSRQEAVFSCALHRYLKDNKVDVNHLLQEIAVKENIPSDLTVWENRKQASAKLVDTVGHFMVSLINKNHSSQLMERLRTLEQENSHLRASQMEMSATPI